MRTAIYPGSFDPVTNGHRDIIDRASRTFDRVIVSILENPRKAPLFSVMERMEMLKLIVAGYSNVEVDWFRGLLIDYAKQKDAGIIIKGLRGMGDFEFEFQMALVNHKLSPDVETLFMMTNNRYSYVSSSIVKEIAYFGGDISELIPFEVYETVMQKIKS